jgi:hypothetical protein
MNVHTFFFLNVSAHISDVCVCVYICISSQLYMYSCACSRASHQIGRYNVITCEYSQGINGSGKTALLWASEGGQAETVRVLVELGASLEAVDKVNIHAHALAYTCCIKAVSGIMRMTMVIMSHAYACRCMYLNIQEGHIKS